MEFFELILVLLVGAVGLTALARRLQVPYPALLALGGTAIALLPHAPQFQLDPELTLALFVAPVLLDAAYDTIGLQLRPILSALEPAQRIEYLQIAAMVLGVVVLARFAWVFIYYCAARLKARYFGDGVWPGAARPSIKSAVVVGWCGMRGIVTLAAAYALPVGNGDSAAFPYRDLIVLCAFCVVVGTLVLQGFTLRPLILWLELRDDSPVDREASLSLERLTRIGLAILDADESPEAQALRRELESQLAGSTPSNPSSNGQSRYEELRTRIIAAQRNCLLEMRAQGEIGDDAFHQMEARLDLAKVNAEHAGA